jgi:hypothetical protein
LKAFPKRNKEIEQNIVVLKVLMQVLTFAQFGALIYTFLRTQWHDRHETADKFNKLKNRASSIGGRLRSRSSKGGRSDGDGNEEAAVTAAGGDDGAASTETGSGGAVGSGDRSGVELQAMSRSASTEMDVANPFRRGADRPPSGVDLSDGGGDKSGVELQGISRKASTDMIESV